MPITVQSTPTSAVSQYSTPPNNLQELEVVMASLPHLPPQVARFVALLIFHRGRVVRHRVMYKHLWPHAKQFERYKLTQEAVRARHLHLSVLQHR